MPILRQTHLGVSANGEVCIEMPLPPDALRSAPPRPCWISPLPDELLTEIFFRVPKISWYESTHSGQFPLSLVSKRWHRIYQRVLFHDIHITSKKMPTIAKLKDLLRAQPHLRQYPNIIHLGVSSYHPFSSGTARLLQEIVTLCTALRTVALHTYWRHEMLGLVQAIKSLPLLENLMLSGYSGGPAVHLIFQNFMLLPSLKTIRLDRYGVPEKPSDPEGPWPRIKYSITQSELEELLPPSKYGTSNLVDMTFSDPTAPINVTEHMLRAPAHLAEITIFCLTHSTTFSEFNGPTLQRLLSMHQSSLKRITLGIFCSTGDHPNFSSFPCLEELTMSAYGFMKQDPTTAFRNVAAPKLRILSLSFCTEDQHSESCSDFGPVQVQWMKDFASHKTTQYPKSRLEKLFIHFRPEESPQEYQERAEPYEWDPPRRIWGNPEYGSWPWEHVEQAKQAVAEQGLVLEYSAPWTKEEWDRIVRNETVEEPDPFEYLQPGMSELYRDEA